MAALYTQAECKRGTAKGSQGIGLQVNGLRCLPMKTEPILTAGHSSDYRMELLDRYTQVKDGDPDEQLANELFQAFKSVIAVSFGDVFFVKRCYKWPFE